jgi:O-antigen biosynthesis alpha-1,2-rhamnosyltransferase
MLGRRLFVYHDGSDTELDYLYRHARALLFPSAVEGFGLPLVEARQRGCLVLASDIPVFRELADDWVKLFPLDDAKHLARAVLDVAATAPQRPPAMAVYGWQASAGEFLSKVQALAGRRP